MIFISSFKKRVCNTDSNTDVRHWYPTTTLHGVTTQKTSTWHLNLVTRLRMCGAIPPLPNTSSWRCT